MKDYLGVLKRTGLFNGLSEKEILTALDCLSAQTSRFCRHNRIFCEGEQTETVGIILSGEIQTRKADYNGNINIVSKLFPAEIIAASACYSTEKCLPFDVVCVSECEVLWLNTRRLVQPCAHACPFHIRLMQNLLKIIADRNVFLASKIDILTKRTIREKTLAYLYAQSKKAKSKRFSIPLSRRQMAEYLSVNRSALSRELCNLRDTGLLEFEQNSFLLKT